jgi:hypothetical protein
MSYTATDLDNIERAIASGELVVSIGDKSVTYRSMSELIKARDIIKGELVAANAIPTPGPRTSYASFSKD